MKVLMITNFGCFHQTSIWDVFVKETNAELTLLETGELTEERKKQKYQEEKRDYIVSFESLNEEELVKLFSDSDFVIIGSIENKEVYKYLKYVKTAIFAREHIYKHSLVHNSLSFIKNEVLIKDIYLKNAEKYALCFSYYAGEEFLKDRINPNHIYKFGYFPMLHDIETKSFKDRSNSYLACSRLLPWKRQELSLSAVKHFNEINKLDDSLMLIGEGPEKDNLEKISNKTNTNIVINPFMENEKVLQLMADSKFFIMPSNKQEGWGVVVNEAMSQGCIVIASALAGSTKMLIKNGYNGFIFDGSEKDLFKVVERISNLEDTQLESISENARKSINELWNYEVAGTRLAELLTNLSKDKDYIPPYEDGPIAIFKEIK